MAAIGLLLALPPIRGLLFLLKVLPLPGEGPSQETRDSGHFHTWVLGVGESSDAAAAITTSPAPPPTPPPMVIADVRSGNAGDPGYKATAQMSVEAALCLAHDVDKCAASGGVLTPASAMGDALVARLIKSGMRLSARVIRRQGGD